MLISLKFSFKLSGQRVNSGVLVTEVLLYK